MKYILLAILGYFLFRFVVGFLLPILRTTAQVRRKVREMQQQQAFYQRQQQQETAGTSARKSSSTDKGDYIDFEEIKS